MKLFRNLTRYANPNLGEIRVKSTIRIVPGMIEGDGLTGQEIMIERSYKTPNPKDAPYTGIGLAFGNAQAPCTKRLALAMHQAREYYGTPFPIIAQQALLVNLRGYGARNFLSIDSLAPEERIIGKVSKPGAVILDEYPVEARLNTFEALELARGIYKNKGLSLGNCLFFAHPAHMERVMNAARKLGFEGRPFVEGEVSWNWGLRDATSSPFRWIVWELMARVKGTIDDKL
jgi:hypothetical protein